MRSFCFSWMYLRLVSQFKLVEKTNAWVTRLSFSNNTCGFVLPTAVHACVQDYREFGIDANFFVSYKWICFGLVFTNTIFIVAGKTPYQCLESKVVSFFMPSLYLKKLRSSWVFPLMVYFVIFLWMSIFVDTVTSAIIIFLVISQNILLLNENRGW